MKNILIFADPTGNHSLSAIKKGFKPENIWVWENDPAHFYAIKQIDARINLVEDINCLNMNFDLFDLNIGNPPFKGQLHLEFLKIALQKSKNVKLIHPSGWLTRSEKEIEREIKDLLKNRLKKLSIFVGISKFPTAQFQCPLVITECDEKYNDRIEVHYQNSGNTYYLDSLDDFPTGYWEPTKINYTLKNLISEESKKSNLLSLRTTNLSYGKIPLNLPTICGDFRSKDVKNLARVDTYLFYYPNSNLFTDKNNEGKFYSLNSEKERDNLLSYLKTKFARFALALNKATNRNNVSRYIENIPLPPLDKSWTEETIVDYYKITKEQWNAIDEFIPTYYS